MPTGNKRSLFLATFGYAPAETKMSEAKRTCREQRRAIEEKRKIKILVYIMTRWGQLTFLSGQGVKSIVRVPMDTNACLWVVTDSGEVVKLCNF